MNDVRQAVADGVKGIMAAERGQVAFDTARALGYEWTDAMKYRTAAERATRAGWDSNRNAGRVSIGTRTSPLGGKVHVLSVMVPTGAYYDPTLPTSPGNNAHGSD